MSALSRSFVTMNVSPALGLGLVFLLAACPKAAPSEVKDAGVNDDGPSLSGEIKATYEVDAPTHPQAEKLCHALHGLPHERQTACCKFEPGDAFVEKTCKANLSAALAAKALVVDEARVTACAAAMDTATQGCGWVGTLRPPVPAACLDVVSGAVARGQRCRSSLECGVGDFCQGVGPTQAGRCGPPSPTGSGCGRGIDPLASFLGGDVGARRECAGFCSRSRCQAAVAVGAACVSNVECGDGHCAAGACAAGAVIAVGGACADGGCVVGARCTHHVCVAPKDEGEACKSDFECRGSCVGAPDGRCGMHCPTWKDAQTR